MTDDEADGAYSGYGEVYGGVFKSDPLEEIKNLRSQAMDSIQNFDQNDRDGEGRYILDPGDSIQLFTYFTMTAAILEELSIVLLSNELTDTDTSSKTSSSAYFENDLTQYQRQKLLLHCGIIGDGIHGEMDRIRNHRNDIVHSSRQRKLVENMNEIEDKVNAGVRAVEDLWEKV